MDAFALDGQVVIVTGGRSGIGFATARALASAGARVLICGRRADEGEAAAQQLAETTGGTVQFAPCDVTDEASVDDAVAACVDRLGPPTVLVNNAGPTDLLHRRDVDGPAGSVDPDGWHRVQDAALTGTYLCTRAVLPHLVASGDGAIVNVTSIAAAAGMPGIASYSAAKAGVEALTRSVAIEYAHLGVRCNAVRVGTVRVPHGDDGDGTVAMADRVDRDTPVDVEARPPRPGHPDDVAHAVHFLVSPASRYVTGAVLPVDGGMLARSLMPWVCDPPAPRPTH